MATLKMMQLLGGSGLLLDCTSQPSPTHSQKPLIEHLYLTTEGIWGVPLGVSADFIYLFVLFGTVLDVAGGGRLLTGLSAKIAGSTRGGPAKTAAVASALMGSISGSAVANTVGTGSITIPLMKRVGFQSKFAGGVEAAASTGGQLLMGWVGVRKALPWGCLVLVAGLLLVGASLLLASLPLLLLGAVTGGVGQGMAFRAGLTEVGSAAPDTRRGATISAFLGSAISVGMLCTSAARARISVRTVLSLIPIAASANNPANPSPPTATAPRRPSPIMIFLLRTRHSAPTEAQRPSPAGRSAQPNLPRESHTC